MLSKHLLNACGCEQMNVGAEELTRATRSTGSYQPKASGQKVTLKKSALQSYVSVGFGTSKSSGQILVWFGLAWLGFRVSFSWIPTLCRATPSTQQSSNALPSPEGGWCGSRGCRQVKPWVTKALNASDHWAKGSSVGPRVPQAPQ